MISILLGSRGNPYHLNDLLRSLSNNASSKDAYEVLIKLDDDDPFVESIKDTIASYHHVMHVRYLVSPRRRGYEDLHIAYEELYKLTTNPDLIWVLSDDVIILGASWDKYINYYKDTNKLGDVFVMIPTNMVNYVSQSDESSLEVMDNYPIWSRKWLDTVGFGPTFSTDSWTNRILRELFVNYRRDLRIPCRGINLMRKQQPADLPGSDRWNTTRKDMITFSLSPEGKALLKKAVDGVSNQ